MRTKANRRMLGHSSPHSLIDREIYNQDGEQLGRIIKIVTNPDDAVAYAVLRLGGDENASPPTFAIPPKSLDFSGNGKGTLTLELGKDLHPALNPLDEKSIEDVNRQETLGITYLESSQLLLSM